MMRRQPAAFFLQLHGPLLGCAFPMQLASIFQDHAVLQRYAPIPVWGKGTPGEKVTVCFAGVERSATVDATGNWVLWLPSMKEGGPYTLTARTETEVVEVDDLLVGEVWICSGQSNMEWQLRQVEGTPAQETAPTIRLLTVRNPAGLGRADEVTGEWRVATSAALMEFSAVGGYFGRFLQEELGVPVGLICNAWGGTRIQAWMSREALMLEPEGRDEIRSYEAFLLSPDAADTIPNLANWERQARFHPSENPGLESGWASVEFDDSSWRSMKLPGYWQQRGHEHSGIFWFRKTVSIPQDWRGKDLEISLGPIDKHDETWVNGTLVGGMGWETDKAWDVPRCYRIGADLIGADGHVTVAVRVRSHVFAGGFAGWEDMLWLAPADAQQADRINLSGAWRYEVEADWGETAPPPEPWGAENPNTPGMLFNRRVAPLIPYAFRGVIWYQGESNEREAKLYRRFLPRLIEDWRRVWGAGAFPFIQTQLANYENVGWPELREAQLSALELKNTGIAVTIDIGEAKNVHPQNKRDVGFRLAQCALYVAYDRKAAALSPLFDSMAVEKDGRVRCLFRHTGGGLTAKNGALRHFELAGWDKVFHPAEAAVEGDTVVVFSPDVPQPSAVRYAWANNPEGCNLYNAHGLPASPFRSDAWPV